MTFECPHCAGHLEADAEIAGMEFACPHCQTPLVVPGESGPINTPTESTAPSTRAEKNAGKRKSLAIAGSAMAGAIVLLVALMALTKPVFLGGAHTGNQAESKSQLAGRWKGTDGLLDELMFRPDGRFKAYFYIPRSVGNPVPLGSRGSWWPEQKDGGFAFMEGGEVTPGKCTGDRIVLQRTPGTSLNFIRTEGPEAMAAAAAVADKEKADLEKIIEKVVHAIEVYQRKHGGTLAKDWAALVVPFEYGRSVSHPDPSSLMGEGGPGYSEIFADKDLRGPVFGKLLELISKDGTLTASDITDVKQASLSIILDFNRDGVVEKDGDSSSGCAMVSGTVEDKSIDDYESVSKTVK
jgi:hypothetical protein